MSVHHYEKVYVSKIKAFMFYCSRCGEFLTADGTPVEREEA